MRGWRMEDGGRGEGNALGEARGAKAARGRRTPGASEVVRAMCYAKRLECVRPAAPKNKKKRVFSRCTYKQATPPGFEGRRKTKNKERTRARSGL